MCNMCERCDDELVSVHKLANIIVEILFSVFSCAIYSGTSSLLLLLHTEYKRERTERVNLRGARGSLAGGGVETY
jgi:hypothetical protein